MIIFSCTKLTILDYNIDKVNHNQVYTKYCDESVKLCSVQGNILDIKGIYSVVDGIDIIDTYILLDSGDVVCVHLINNKNIKDSLEIINSNNYTKSVKRISNRSISELEFEYSKDVKTDNGEIVKLYRVIYKSNVVMSGESDSDY